MQVLYVGCNAHHVLGFTSNIYTKLCKLLRIFVQIYKMQRLIFGFILLFFISSSCKRGLPSGILKKDTMVELLGEVHVLDGYLTTIPIDSAKRLMDPLYDELFSKYGLDSASFTKNLDYYYGDPDLSVETYDRVVKSLQEKENEFIKEDSIRNAIFSDSIRTANFQNLRWQGRMNSLMNAKADTLPYGIAEVTRRTLSPTGLDIIWKNNIYEKPSQISATAAQPQNVTEQQLPTVTSSDLPQEAQPQEAQPQEVQPQEEKPQELKPVGNGRPTDIRRPLRTPDGSQLKPVKPRRPLETAN